MICLYAEINHPWTEHELADKLLLLPDELRQAALRKRQWMDKQLAIAGKLLLIHLLKKLKLSGKLSLADLNYTTYHRPYFDSDMDFNITHSGNIVMCGGTFEGKVGIDIEHIKPIDLGDYTDYFTLNEWDLIHRSKDNEAEFYHYWTRKEAVIKAIGTGFHTPLSSVDVSEKSLVYEDIIYHLQALSIDDEYKCHIASTAEIENIQLIRVNL